MDHKRLLAEFDDQMLDIYRRANAEAHYNPTIFLRMLGEKGGLQTARELILREEPSEGYKKLWELGRLDLTVEAVIYGNPKWHPLFSEEELAACEKQLRKYRYTGLSS